MKISALALTLILFTAAQLRAQTSFFEGKTIKIVVGLPAGDVYDVYAPLLATYMGKHIPGNPNIMVQNMPGAASMIAANYVYNVAKPDGLTFAAPLPSLYFDQLLGRKEVKFDWRKFVWLGSFETSNNLIYMRTDTPFKSIHDLTRAVEPAKCGSTGTGHLLISWSNCSTKRSAPSSPSSPVIKAARRSTSPWSAAKRYAAASP